MKPWIFESTQKSMGISPRILPDSWKLRVPMGSDRCRGLEHCMLCAGLITFQFCWTFCMLRTCDILYSYWATGFSKMFSTEFNLFNMFTMHSRMKSCCFWLLNLPFKSPGSRIVLFSLQKDNLLSFQTLNSSSIPLNISWRDFLAGVNNGINAGIGSSSPECWIHIWYSVDPDTWKLGHRVDHMIL